MSTQEITPADKAADAVADEPRTTFSMLPWRWRRRRQIDRIPWISISTIVVLLILPAIFADVITVHDPLRGILADRLTPPMWLDGGSSTYPLGTDKQGRDILTRIIYGARISLTVSIVTIFIGVVIGSTLGLMAGYLGGWVDRIISWLIDTFFSLPYILLALVIVAAIGPSFATIIFILSITIWAPFARQVRGETLSVREEEFIARAQVAGSPRWRILFKHILPNITNTLIVLATLQVGVVILNEASLSFIGAGIPRPNPAWGLMVADGRDQVLIGWWLSFFPGLAILLVVLALNLTGDWLRDYMDPKLRQRG